MLVALPFLSYGGAFDGGKHQRTSNISWRQHSQ